MEINGFDIATGGVGTMGWHMLVQMRTVLLVWPNAFVELPFVTPIVPCENTQASTLQAGLFELDAVRPIEDATAQLLATALYMRSSTWSTDGHSGNEKLYAWKEEQACQRNFPMARI